MRKRKSTIIAFAVEMSGVEYPVALFKLLRTKVCGWTMEYSKPGHLILLDPREALSGIRLSQGNIFTEVEDAHFTYPLDGRYHQTVKAAERDTEHLHRDKVTALPNVECSSFRSITIPLTDHFYPMEAAVWKEAKDPIILRSSDFNNAQGLTLHCYVCRTSNVRSLLRRWPTAKRHWRLGDGDLQIVVLAEPFEVHPRHSIQHPTSRSAP